MPLHRRARRLSALLAGVLAMTLAGVGTGCKSQQQQQAQRTGLNLAPPNFNGPNIVTPPPAVAVAPPPAPAPQPVRPRPQPQPYAGAQGNVPRSWIPAAAPRQWRWIVIHHSATPAGSAAVFDKEHREKGWDGLGYDFVIGNGTDSGNGQVEVGYRWTKQLIGAHAKTADNRFNEQGIGICLVGNFDVDRPTQAQLQSLTRLITYLMRTYHIPASGVLGHRETKPTDCPGRNINVAAIRRIVSQSLAATGQAPASDDDRAATLAASQSELLLDRPTR